MAKKQTLTAALAETPAQEPITETTPQPRTPPYPALIGPGKPTSLATSIEVPARVILRD